ncbi:fimbrial protein PilE [Methylocaldum marinum]|uniref:Fimbrial protein PilE n=1 Tax=Methylocaldum marinum TaxID=1432792 RepID=A0A250KWU0_9GAMM|nr:pilin [Methylocaldum marinum]BBA35431.1 fimbrial protein PilE [Methylocaldum marinum]
MSSIQRTQKGFTLIELMIVVAIIGILAAIGIPAYQDYLNRSKVLEAVTAAGACKTGVMEYAAATSTLPASAAEAGCSIDPTQYVQELAVAAGKITITLRNVHTDVNGATLVLSPTNDSDPPATAAANGDSILGWHCGTSADPAHYKYFPANCRKEVL